MLWACLSWGGAQRHRCRKIRWGCLALGIEDGERDAPCSEATRLPASWLWEVLNLVVLLIQCHHSTPRVPCAWITVPNWSQLASQAQPSQTLLHLLCRLQLLITPVPLPPSSLPQSPVLSSLQHPRPLCAIFTPVLCFPSG